ncbi:hypothetical protein VP01_917g5 [Puccinia sorghi]|uniref:SET domain-containing protein n=1 Tax=Puccinia sorghi TaxID=27349 RepID=A0A0L6U9I8_9BASI|nr:hypothetical protein VP01_917g5 [Puccinia sorghi]
MVPFLLALSTLAHFLLRAYASDSIKNSVLFNLGPSPQLHCKKWESPLVASLQTPNHQFYADEFLPTIPQKMEPFKKNFFKHNCTRHPLDTDPEAYCIFLNLNLNRGMGMVIVAKESIFEASLQNLDFSEDLMPASGPPAAIKVVAMPEKGGAGAVAHHGLRRGQPVAQIRAVGIFPNDPKLWWTEFGKSYRRQALELLPPRTRHIINSLLSDGRAKSQDDFLASVLKQNTFSTHLNPKLPMLYSALVLEPVVRLNHACRPNVGYYMDHATQTIHMMALREISAGEELTISYRSPELTRKLRRESLEIHYGFRCSCSHCQMDAEQGRLSDHRVQRILEFQYMHYTEPEWLSIEQVQELVRNCQREDLPYSLVTAYYIAAQVYNAHGRTQEAAEFAKKARRDGLMFVGPKWEYLEGAQLLSESPQKHDSYMDIIFEED